MTNHYNISGGLYLVIDPATPSDTLFTKLQQALKEGVKIVQVIDNWQAGQKVKTIINELTDVCHSFHVPLLLNNHWELLRETNADGIHFDSIPDDFKRRRKDYPPEALYGITCGNDLSVVQWAGENQLDYISFCSMFPSPSAGSCEIVTPESIRKARAITSVPIFLAGGIHPENIKSFEGFGINGIALISGIMGADDAVRSTRDYVNSLKKITS